VEIVSLIAFAALATKQQVPEPALWLRPDGHVTIEGRTFSPSISPGTHAYRTARGIAWDFDGKRAGLLFGDLKPLVITDSMTVSVWLNLRSYVNDGPGAQILFRGDDRPGVDPYTLAILSDGTVRFAVQNEFDRGRITMGDIPLNRWVHVLGSWQSDTGELRLWINDELVSYQRTSIRPFADLDQGQAPGVGIGNVQNNHGPHNQPVNGQIFDLRLYRGAFTPDQLGIFNNQPLNGDPPPRG
jgi:hypothetical protein